MPYDYSAFDKPTDEKKDSNLSTEEQARAMGWRPRKEFKGESDDWVEAEVFLSRTELYRRVQKLNQENRWLRKQVENLKQQLQKKGESYKP